MIQSVNAPIHLFMKYVNEFFPSQEPVVIFVVDEYLEINSDIPLIGETEDGELYLGRYWRQEEEPHIILVRQELKVSDTIGVLAHEYVHHLIWEDSMLNMTDAEIHKIPIFEELWEKIAEGCLDYIQNRCDIFGFDTENV
jgi:hypothetical protein